MNPQNTDKRMEEEVNTIERPTTSSEVERVDPSSVLNIRHILQNVFSFLNAGDLCSCAQVSTVWRREARFAKKKRRLITLILKRKFTLHTRLWTRFRSRQLRKAIFGQRAVPNVALISSRSSTRWNLEGEITTYLFLSKVFGDRFLDGLELPNRFCNLVQIMKQQNKRFSKSYPTRCGFFHIPVPIIEGNAWFNSYHGINDQETTILNFPSNPLLRVHPFLVNNQTIVEKIKPQSSVEPLYFTEGENNMEEKIQCIILFLSFCDDVEILDTIKLRNTIVGSHIREETVVVGLRSWDLLFTTGIAFSGENVRTECVHISERACCANHQFVYFLKNTLAIEETGLCFVIPDVDVDNNFFGYILHLFATMLPGVTPMFFNSPEVSVKYAGHRCFLEQRCESCSLRTCECEDEGVKVLFILLQNVRTKTVRV